MSARLFVLVALASLVTVSYGIDCYQCAASRPNSDCETSVTAAYNATACSTGSYCGVAIIKTDGTVTSFARSCSPIDSPSGCETLQNVEACVSFCDTDGCNTAGMVRASALFMVMSAILAAVLYIIY